MSAVISECGQYRYLLRRSLGSVLRWYRPMLFIMLNPSTADASQDDPTIRRCMGFAKREGATHLTVVNLFGLRATAPKELEGHPDPVGPENDRYLIEECGKHYMLPIIAAWGSNRVARGRAEWLRERLGHWDVIYDGLHCLGKTKDGHPKHPLYLPKDSEVERLWGGDE